MIKKVDIFEGISQKDISQCSIGILYGGNKLTSWGCKVLGQISPPTTHAFLVYTPVKVNSHVETVIYDVGITVYKDLIDKYFQSTKRVDIISIPTTAKEKKAILTFAEHTDKKNYLYDWKGYMSFVPFIGKLFKPSKKHPFCSDFVVDCFESAGIKVSAKNSEKTAPWDLLIYALNNNFQINTLWVGSDFIQKYTYFGTKKG